MRTELPELKRCFCCVPLRYGLVIWGYLRLIDVALSFYYKAVDLSEMMGDENKDWTFVMTWIIIVLESIDFVIIIIFIIGAHRKNVLLLKIYFYFSLGELVIQFFMLVALGIYFVYLYHVLYVHNVADFRPSSVSWGLMKAIVMLSGYLLLVGYVLLLVRNEIKKLSSNYRFQFVNNAADSKCVIKLEYGFENGEEGIKTGAEEIKNGGEGTKNEMEGTSDLHGNPREMLGEIDYRSISEIP